MESMIFPLLIVLLAVPLFLQARKQKRAVAEQQKLQNEIGVGDRVMTTSGMYGTVVSTDEKTIELELAPGVTTTWVRQAVREKVVEETTGAVEDNDDAEPKAVEADAVKADDTAAAKTEATEETAADDATDTKVAEQAKS